MRKTYILILLFFITFFNQLKADRLKDLVSIAGIRTNQLLGYGIVIGLNGTGDSTTNPENDYRNHPHKEKSDWKVRD